MSSWQCSCDRVGGRRYEKMKWCKGGMAMRGLDGFCDSPLLLGGRTLFWRRPVLCCAAHSRSRAIGLPASRFHIIGSCTKKQKKKKTRHCRRFRSFSPARKKMKCNESARKKAQCNRRRFMSLPCTRKDERAARAAPLSPFQIIVSCAKKDELQRERARLPPFHIIVSCTKKMNLQ